MLLRKETREVQQRAAALRLNSAEIHARRERMSKTIFSIATSRCALLASLISGFVFDRLALVKAEAGGTQSKSEFNSETQRTESAKKNRADKTKQIKDSKATDFKTKLTDELTTLAIATLTTIVKSKIDDALQGKKYERNTKNNGNDPESESG